MQAGLLLGLPHRRRHRVLPRVDLALGERPVVVAGSVHQQHAATGPEHDHAGRPDGGRGGGGHRASLTAPGRSPGEPAGEIRVTRRRRTVLVGAWWCCSWSRSSRWSWSGGSPRTTAPGSSRRWRSRRTPRSGSPGPTGPASATSSAPTTSTSCSTRASPPTSRRRRPWSSSATTLQQRYGFSPQSLDWELFSQGTDAAVVLMGLADGAADTVAGRLRDLGYAEPKDPTGVWRGSNDLLAQDRRGHPGADVPRARRGAPPAARQRHRGRPREGARAARRRRRARRRRGDRGRRLAAVGRRLHRRPGLQRARDGRRRPGRPGGRRRSGGRGRGDRPGHRVRDRPSAAAATCGWRCRSRPRTRRATTPTAGPRWPPARRRARAARSATGSPSATSSRTGRS